MKEKRFDMDCHPPRHPPFGRIEDPKKLKNSDRPLRTFVTGRCRRKRVFSPAGSDVLVIALIFIVFAEQIFPASCLSCYVCGGATGRPCGEIRFDLIKFSELVQLRLYLVNNYFRICFIVVKFEVRLINYT